jgi:hypothetical protein
MRFLSGPNYKFSKNVCVEKIRSVVQQIMMSQTNRTVLMCVCVCGGGGGGCARARVYVRVCVYVYIYDDDQWACSCLVQIMSCYSLLY